MLQQREYSFTEQGCYIKINFLKVNFTGSFTFYIESCLYYDFLQYKFYNFGFIYNITTFLKGFICLFYI